MSFGNCSAAGRLDGCKVPRHALATVDDEGRITAFLTVIAQPMYGGSRSLTFILKSTRTASKENGIPQGSWLLFSCPKFDPPSNCDVFLGSVA